MSTAEILDFIPSRSMEIEAILPASRTVTVEELLKMVRSGKIAIRSELELVETWYPHVLSYMDICKRSGVVPSFYVVGKEVQSDILHVFSMYGNNYHNNWNIAGCEPTYDQISIEEQSKFDNFKINLIMLDDVKHQSIVQNSLFFAK
jgi:hypothetical protein